MHDVRRWIVVGQLLAALAAQAQVAVEEAKPEERKSAVVIALWGGSSVVGAPGVGTSVGLGIAHRFGSVELWLGVGAGASAGNDLTGINVLSIAIEPGARLYLPGARGMWLGSGVLAGYSGWAASNYGVHTWTAGLTPAVGFTHVFDSGLLVQLSAGPQVQLAWTRVTSEAGVGGLGGSGAGLVAGASNSAMVGLRAGAGIGWAF